MEVPSSFAQRLADIAGSTPRNVLENLLMGLAPRVPVKARAIPTDSGGRALPPLKLDADGMVVGPTTRERMMVRKLVRDMGGRLEATSPPPEQGETRMTVFTVTLPLERAEEDHAR